MRKISKTMIDGATVQFSDDWLLKPVLGQIINEEMEVTLLFKLKTRSKVHCVVNSVDHPQVVVPIDHPADEWEWIYCPPTLVKIKLPAYGLYWFTWLLLDDDRLVDKVIGHHWLSAKAEVDNLYAFSCDMPSADGVHSLWDNMRQNLSSKSTACLHLGDQIYGDAVYRRNMTMDAPSPLKAYGDYSELYQQVWANRTELLCQTWNYFTADDHEITNDLRLYDDLDQKQGLVARAAWKAYLDYQLALVPDREQFYSQCSYATWLGQPGNVRLVMIERTTEPLDIRRLIEEMKQIETNCNYLIVALPCAPVIKPSGLGSSLIRDDRYLDPELALEFYDYLLNLTDDHRAVILLGGDCHYGSHRVVRRGTQSITVVTCSPITNQADVRRAFAALKTKTRDLVPGGLEPRMWEEVVSCHARKNYVEIDFVTEQVIMRYGDSEPKSMLNYVKNLWSMRKP